VKTESLTLSFDNDTLTEYEKYYFSIHTKAKKKPIAQPYHESMNVWMIMRRPMMNALKQKWKDFMVWFIENQGYTNLRINKCEMTFDVYYPNTRKHDCDNCTPKFIIDGLCESGFIVDDDSDHVQSLTLRCHTDRDRPRTEINVNIIEYYDESKEEIPNGKEGKNKHKRIRKSDEGE